VSLTHEQLLERKKYIGASDAPAVMRVSPWKTPLQLWMDKVSDHVSTFTTPAMQRGNELEERARQCFENMTGLVMFPNKVKVHETIPYMRASLDGMDIEEQNFVEIKCVNLVDHTMAMAGKVPEKYVPQVMHQLEVCQLDMGYYFSFDGKDGVIVKVYRDEKYIKNLIKEEENFWQCVENFIAPPMTEKDYKIMTSQEWQDIAGRWLSTKKQLKELEKAEAELRGSLILMTEERNCTGSGVCVQKKLRKGNVDYSKIPELQGKNLDIFRKSNIEYWQIEEARS